ncbi:MAG: PEGA domain-containing protein [Candidatus Kerfeldbacteria bacterium]|nr:PEGA domain-containing protein [Candidatus Kerfeldbacteria bacterium]
MNVFQRRILYLAAIAVFLVLAPIVLLYGQGWRLDFRRAQVVRTGGIYIDSFPQRASVTINSRPMSRLTPISIFNLRPGVANVVIDKPGWQPWSGRITVVPQSLTQVAAVMMPSPVSSLVLPESQSVPISFDRSRGQLLYLIQQANGTAVKALTLDPPAVQTIAILPVTGKVHQATASATHKYIALVTEKLGLIVLRRNDVGLVTFDFPASSTPSRISWHPTDDEEFYFLDRGSLWQADMAQGQMKVAASPNIKEFMIGNDALWVIRQTSIMEKLQRLNVKKQNDVLEEIRLDFAVDKILYVSSEAFIISNKNSVVFLNRQAGLINSIQLDKIKAHYLDSTKRWLLLLGDSEVWTVDVRTGEFTLVSRRSDLRDALWYQRLPAIFMLTDRTVQIISTKPTPILSGAAGEFVDPQQLFSLDESNIGIVEANRLVIWQVKQR